MDTVAKPETQCRHLLLMVKYHLKDDLVDCRGKSTTVLVSAGIELTFFLVAGTACSGFSRKVMLITR